MQTNPPGTQCPQCSEKLGIVVTHNAPTPDAGGGASAEVKTVRELIDELYDNRDKTSAFWTRGYLIQAVESLEAAKREAEQGLAESQRDLALSERDVVEYKRQAKLYHTDMMGQRALRDEAREKLKEAEESANVAVGQARYMLKALAAKDEDLKQSQLREAALKLAINEAFSTLIELNLNNYNHDDVQEANNGVIAASGILTEALRGEGETK
jgi:hypothetical protein